MISNFNFLFLHEILVAMHIFHAFASLNLFLFLIKEDEVVAFTSLKSLD